MNEQERLEFLLTGKHPERDTPWKEREWYRNDGPVPSDGVGCRVRQVLASFEADHHGIFDDVFSWDKAKSRVQYLHSDTFEKLILAEYDDKKDAQEMREAFGPRRVDPPIPQPSLTPDGRRLREANIRSRRSDDPPYSDPSRWFLH
jgi:hypothetical protein